MADKQPHDTTQRVPPQSVEERRAARKHERTAPPPQRPAVDPQVANAIQRASHPRVGIEADEAEAIEGTGRAMAARIPRTRAEGTGLPEDEFLADTDARLRAAGDTRVAAPARTRFDGGDYADRMPQRHPPESSGGEAGGQVGSSGAAAQLVGKALDEAGTVEKANAEVDKMAEDATPEERRMVFEAALEGERAVANRKGVVAHIEARLAELDKPQDDGSDDSGGGGSGSQG